MMGSDLLITGVSGLSDLSRSTRACQSSLNLDMIRFHIRLAAVGGWPIVSWNQTSLQATSRHVCNLTSKTYGGCGMDPLRGASGIGLGTLPPGLHRLSAICFSNSLLKSSRSATVAMPSLASCTTIAFGIAICAASSKKSFICAWVKTMFSRELTWWAWSKIKNKNYPETCLVNRGFEFDLIWMPSRKIMAAIWYPRTG